MSAQSNPRLVHLCGSVALDSAAAVFKMVGEELGPLAPRMPDGETGERGNWLAWQDRFFAACNDLEPEINEALYAAKEPSSGPRRGLRRPLLNWVRSVMPRRRWIPTPPFVT